MSGSNFLGQPKKSGNETVTRTIRLEADVDSKLAELAGKEKVSVNLVVNRALRRQVEWEAYAERFGFMTTSHSVMKKLFSRLTDEDAREMGRDMGENTAPEFITFWFKKFDFDALLKGLELLGTEYGRAFNFDQSFDGKNHTLILKHNMGPRTSAYYAEAMKSVLESLDLQAEVVESEEQVTVKVFR